MTVLSRLFGQAPSPTQTSTESNGTGNDAAEPIANANPEQGVAPVGRLDLEALLSPSIHSVSAERVQEAIAAIDDPASLNKLAIFGASTIVRQFAAQAIHDPAQLRNLLKDVRGKDKSVYKIIREKCDALLAVEKATAETQATIAALCAALERHVYVPFDNLFAPALEHFAGQWSHVASQAEPEMQLRADKAIARCREIIEEQARAKNAQAAREAAIAAADSDRQSLIAELRGFLASLYSHSSPVDSPVASHVEQWTSRWNELARYKPASQNDQALFAQLTKAIEQLAALVARHGSVDQQVEALRIASLDDANSHATGSQATGPQATSPHAKTLRRMLDAATVLGEESFDGIADAKSVLQAYEQARKEKQDAEANALRQLGGLIRKASGALSAGNTRLAAGLRRAVEAKMKSLPEVPPHLTNQVQQLDQKLNLLQDWRSYAVAPKRIELIEHMEALIGLDENPQTLADQIKRLQDDWKTISKGSTDDTDADWQRFHQAAQKAYEPCREYFTAQAKQREGNLAKRKTLLERLARFVAAQDWQATDWREVARALRESKQQWRNHQFVERAANKPLQVRFDELTRDLESRLEAESASNVEAKKALIARAKALLNNEDGRQAIDAIKQLQAKWSSIGITARADDQKLWSEFRQHCDAVFAKRQQQRTEYVASLDEAKRKAIALCEEAEQLATLSGSELVEGAKKLSALSELFEALGDLPKADARGLQNRFERALKQCEKAVAAQRNRDKAQSWDRVLDAGNKIRSYRLAIANASSEVQEAAKQEALAFIDSVTQWPKGALQFLKTELAKPGEADLVANEYGLRTLCIRAEILTDSTTPEADQSFRRNYQLQRLIKGLGQSASGSRKDELEAMVFEWIGIGATTDAVYDELLARFNRCRARA